MEAILHQSDESAMDALAQLVTPADFRCVISLQGDNWWLEIGDLELEGPIVTIQREEELIAAVSRRDDGRLRDATYRPLDGKSASCLIGLPIVPSPPHGVCMRENNWEYALDCSAGMGNFYAAQRREPYLSLWQFGLGRRSDGATDALWAAKTAQASRRPALVAAEIGTHYELASNSSD